MVTNNKTVIAFDLYGTLLSTESIAKQLAEHFGSDNAQDIAALWRRYQLEYTWRMNSMSLYKPFSDITRASLLHALAESQVSLLDSEVQKLMKAYDNLGTFPDVAPALESIAAHTHIEAYVFSNGTDAMVSSSVTRSPSLSPHAGIFKGLVTVEQVGCYKPHPKVYEHLASKVGKGTGKEDMSSIWLVSGNPFDVVGARAVGMQAVWVDRGGGHHGNGGWTDRLGEFASGGPTVVVSGVEDAVREISRRTGGS